MGVILFYLLAALVILFALGVAFFPNPIFSTLSLVLSMVFLAFIFLMLNAYFIAAVQLLVYAGAIAVLFTLIVMLVDFEDHEVVFAKGSLSTILKITVTGWIAGVLAKVILMSSEMITTSPAYGRGNTSFDTMTIAELLFTKYLFIFEVLGVLLLAVAVGVVAISRINGEKHV